MCLQACAGSKYAAFDDGRTATCRSSNLHQGVPFHTGYFTAAIDVACSLLEYSVDKGSHRAVIDSDSRSAIFQRVCFIGAFTSNSYAIAFNSHHSFRTSKGVGSTLAAAVNITTNGWSS